MTTNYIADPNYQRALFYRSSFLKVVRSFARLYKETNNPKYLEEMMKWGTRTKEMAKNMDGLKR